MKKTQENSDEKIKKLLKEAEISITMPSMWGSYHAKLIVKLIGTIKELKGWDKKN